MACRHLDWHQETQCAGAAPIRGFWHGGWIRHTNGNGNPPPTPKSAATMTTKALATDPPATISSVMHETPTRSYAGAAPELARMMDEITIERAPDLASLMDEEV